MGKFVKDSPFKTPIHVIVHPGEGHFLNIGCCLNQEEKTLRSPFAPVEAPMPELNPPQSRQGVGKTKVERAPMMHLGP